MLSGLLYEESGSLDQAQFVVLQISAKKLLANVTKVSPNTPAKQCNLAAGDMIVAIGQYDASQLTHAQATQVIKSSGNLLQLTVQKGQFNFKKPSGPLKFSPGTAASLTQGRW